MRATRLLVFVGTALGITIPSFGAKLPEGYTHFRCEAGADGVDKTVIEVRQRQFRALYYVDAKVTTERGLKPFGQPKTVLEFSPEVFFPRGIIELGASSSEPPLSSAQDQVDDMARLASGGPAFPGTTAPVTPWVENCRTPEGTYRADACRDRSRLVELIGGNLHRGPSAFLQMPGVLRPFGSFRLETLKELPKAGSPLVEVSWAQYIEELTQKGSPVLDAHGRNIYRLVWNSFRLPSASCDYLE